jgi:outer membrane protein OmpA-like peptidoglycan-associated protein
MKNKMYVRQSVLVAGLCGLLASVAVVGAPATQVSASTPTNGPIYYQTNTGSVAAINVDGSTATVLPFLTGVPAYSADGELVTWVSDFSGPANKLMVANSDGSQIKTLATAASNVSFHKPHFTADKTEIIFYDKNNSTTNIVKVDVATENQTPSVVVASGGNATNITDLAVSKNGDIAFVANACSGTQGVYVRLADETYSPSSGALPNTCANAGTSTQKTAKSIVWDLQGSNLFVSRDDFAAPSKTEIFSAIPGAGITTSALASEDLGSSSSLAVSPDGLKIAYGFDSFAIGKNVKFMNLDGSNSSGPFPLPANALRVIPLGWGHSVASTGGDSSSGSDSDSGDSATTTVPTTTVPTTSVPTSSEAPSVVVPGVTVTDTKVYTRAPKRVAASSAITVLTPLQAKTRKIESNTPSVCLSTNDDIVFIDEGRCSVSILSKKTGRVLKRLRTRVIQDEVSNLQVGNEVAVIAPIYFDGASNNVNARGLRRISSLAPRITAAGTVLVVGHSGIALGDTPENRALSRQRAIATVNAIKKAGGKGPFNVLGVGGKSPLVASTKGEDQAKNRRVVIVLVP